MLALSYQIKLLEDSQELIQPLQNANLDPNSIEAGQPFLPQDVNLYKSYQALVKNIFLLFTYLLLIYFFFNSILWALSHYLLKNNIKEIPQIILKSAASFFFLSIPLIFLFYFLLKKAFLIVNQTDLKNYLILFVILIIIIYYILLHCYAYANINSWKKFLLKIKVAIKNPSKTIPILLINLFLLIISAFSIFLSLNYNESVFLFISSTLFFTLLVITRISWIVCLEEI